MFNIENLYFIFFKNNNYIFIMHLINYLLKILIYFLNTIYFDILLINIYPLIIIVYISKVYF